MFRWDGPVLVFPPFIVYDDGGRRVPYDDVPGEGDYTAVERGSVRIREGEFLNSPEESYVARWLLDDDEEGRPLLLRKKSKDVHPLGSCYDVVVL